ncbi:hypothetical protein AnaeK_3945 [Anaeromyxobacter sp. K]|nr:hypothetical protein AnaeK_3945 [Anaeromyxobacter sp. K]
MSGLHVVEWFRDGPLPHIAPDPALVLAGTRGLSMFVEHIAATGQGGHLAIACAFADARVEGELAALKELPHSRIEVSVVTSSVDDAAATARLFRVHAWRGLDVRALRGMHAKIYAFVGDCGAGACLIGSHNLTPGGARHNSEAGVLFIGSRSAPAREIAHACCEYVFELGARATLVHDNLTCTEDVTS